MKVTILQKDSTSLLARSRDSEKPTTELHTSHKHGGWSRSQKLGFYLVGFTIGFLLSQCIMYRYRRQFGQDYIQIRMEVDVPNEPFNIYIKGSKVQTTGAEKSKHSPWNKLESSLFISALLNAIQDNIRRELENEGFIIADLDQTEKTAPENRVISRRSDLDGGLSVSHGYFRKWVTGSRDLARSGHEWKLLKWFSRLGSRHLGEHPHSDVGQQAETNVVDYAEIAEAPGLG